MKFSLIKQNVPDFRPVVYWHPMIKVADNGMAKIRFTISDAIGNGIIQVVGTDEKGELGWQTLEYEVGFEEK